MNKNKKFLHQRTFQETLLLMKKIKSNKLNMMNKLKTKSNTKIIYDSQEFFTGQYSNTEKHIFDWVSIKEREYIPKVDIVLGTTNKMISALKEKYNLKQPLFRVRNLPLKSEIPIPIINNNNVPFTNKVEFL